jgi:hypothetical protein
VSGAINNSGRVYGHLAGGASSLNAWRRSIARLTVAASSSMEIGRMGAHPKGD